MRWRPMPAPSTHSKYAAGGEQPAGARETPNSSNRCSMRENVSRAWRERPVKSGLLDKRPGTSARTGWTSSCGAMSGPARRAVGRHHAPGWRAAWNGRPPRMRRSRVPSHAEHESHRWRSTAGNSTGRLGGQPRRCGPAARCAIAPRAQGARQLVAHHGNAAAPRARKSGIPATFMLGQAGHETGWGKSEIKNADGSNAHNLFGIKAGKGWTGKVAEVTTTEYINGTPRKVTARFRAYDSYEESFRDYARLITSNPRYEKAMGQTGSALAYATELQKAGYATDPEYASKLSRAIQSAVQSAARYSRQSVSFQTSAGQNMGSGYIGNGVDVNTQSCAISMILLKPPAATASASVPAIRRARSPWRRAGGLRGRQRPGLGRPITGQMNAFGECGAPTDPSARQVAGAQLPRSANPSPPPHANDLLDQRDQLVRTSKQVRADHPDRCGTTAPSACSWRAASPLCWAPTPPSSCSRMATEFSRQRQDGACTSQQPGGPERASSRRMLGVQIAGRCTSGRATDRRPQTSRAHAAAIGDARKPAKQAGPDDVGAKAAGNSCSSCPLTSNGSPRATPVSGANTPQTTCDCQPAQEPPTYRSCREQRRRGPRSSACPTARSDFTDMARPQNPR
ncbi:hypothetical protein FQR65_LT20432 [Abscondita terminalis]|nr:hypothetical protein FQR65_LT20432 [Abscondita terminalis]